MVRPKKDRIVGHNPDVSYFKPRGIPLIGLEETVLTVDELEALRLADFEGLSQEEAGQRMGVSRATFGRIIQQARKSIADALINGKAIRVEGGNYRMASRGKNFSCRACGSSWEELTGTDKPDSCPSCKSDEIKRE